MASRSLGDSTLVPLPEPLTIKVTPCTRFYGPPDAYKNESHPRGALFLANYRSFSNPNTKSRLGSELDTKHILELFGQMGYSHIRVIVDCTKEDTMIALRQFTEEKILMDVDSLVVVFMSHGSYDFMCTSDGKIIQDQEIIELFNNVNCRALRGKPKYFIFQHCRGTNEHIITEMSTDSNAMGRTRVSRKHARREISDIYVCYSTLFGFVSYRYDIGSPYIEKVCRVFMTEAYHRDVDALMKLVDRSMPEAQATEIRRLGFKRDFYFNPYSTEEAASAMSCRTALHEGDSTYKNTSSPAGHVLIVNDLEGCEGDTRKLQDIFTALGFCVLQPCGNITKEKTKETLCNFSKMTHYDSAIVIFYGRGNGDKIVLSDGKVMAFMELIQTLNDISCPNLAGKPKLFILNTCFTDEVTEEDSDGPAMDVTEFSYQEDIVGQAGLSTDGDTELDMAHGTLNIPAERDIYMLNVEVDGNCEKGSLLTEALYQILLTHAHDKELMALTKLILQTLNNLQEGTDEHYYHEVRTIKFQRDYYFHPPKFASPPPTPPKPQEFSLSKFGFPQKRKSVKQVKQPRNTHSDYRNWSRPHGLALIISFEKYESKELPDCPWRHNVAKVMSQLYNDLGYGTETCRNPTNSEAKSRLEEFSRRREHSDLDSVVVIILGLGKNQNTFYCKDGETLHLSDVYSYFTDTSCPGLSRKPKVFFFHMTEMQKWEIPQEKTQRNLRDAFVVRLISKVSESGVHPTKGLWAWRTALEEHAHDTHLESLISKAEYYLHCSDCSSGVSDEHFQREMHHVTGKLFLNPNKV
ncbi:uncharacterized protein LOC122260554 [Penaeus japonicus]|uniref:uncharacterized protein LOC122260554 n=1 Tax=Penaeus japonicus TaxID=27405 RepID=UPI001C70F9DB|nr:uncharacterized protein LOC122260554 [Penaeus japonicus]XP_042883829.1 uncharacterized protein LOC122260554 [Penaeus japonicus]